jgi:hypothetical protein
MISPFYASAIWQYLKGKATKGDEISYNVIYLWFLLLGYVSCTTTPWDVHELLKTDDPLLATRPPLHPFMKHCCS